MIPAGVIRAAQAATAQAAQAVTLLEGVAVLRLLEKAAGLQ